MINGGVLVFYEVGRYLLKAEFSDGKSSHLHVVACEMAALDRIPNEQQDRHLPPRNLQDKSLILRSLCNHAPGFDGSAASITHDRVGSLAQYGC